MILVVAICYVILLLLQYCCWIFMADNLTWNKIKIYFTKMTWAKKAHELFVAAVVIDILALLSWSLSLWLFLLESCECRAPRQGSEMCGYDSLRLDANWSKDLERLEGVWFELMRSDRIESIGHNSRVIHLDIDQKKMTVNVQSAAHTQRWVSLFIRIHNIMTVLQGEARWPSG